MTFIAYGINHKTAPIHIREQAVIPNHRCEDFLYELRKSSSVQAAMFLNTCNRTEIYCDVLDSELDNIHLNLSRVLSPWMGTVSEENLVQHSYCYKAQDAVRHTMRVACGLDSMVLGEPQILGQIKQSYHNALNMGALNDTLQHVFRHVFHVSKRVRSETSISKNPVSIAFTAVSLLRKLFASETLNFTQAKVLIIGSGDTATLMAKYLKNEGVRNFSVASRQKENATLLANALSQEAESLAIHEIPEYLIKSDVVISATNCPFPFIGKEMVQNIVKPLLLLDLAVPRDIETNVTEIPLVSLFNVDDLQELAQEGLNSRQDAVKDAETLIEKEIYLYGLHERTKRASSAIRHYREHAKFIREQELDRAIQKIQQGENPEKILEEFSHRFLEKILHRPTLKLRSAAHQERHDWLDYTTHLYGEVKNH